MGVQLNSIEQYGGSVSWSLVAQRLTCTEFSCLRFSYTHTVNLTETELKIFECRQPTVLRRLRTRVWLQMVKNVIKGSFPISKVFIFEGNS